MVHLLVLEEEVEREKEEERVLIIDLNTNSSNRIFENSVRWIMKNK